MKQLNFLLALLLSAFSILTSKSQNYKLPTPNSEGITDMVVYDREGNTRLVNDLFFQMPYTGGGPSILTIPPTCNAGIFRLHFTDSGTGTGFDDPILGPQRQAVACQVYTDLSLLINEANSPYSSIPNLGSGNSWVEIWVKGSLNNSADPTLGTAGQYFLPTTQGVVHGTVWETINTGIDSWFGVNSSNLGNFGIFHGEMQINFGHNFYLGTNPSLISSTEFDLYTVILHEAIHALGFGSLINQVGNSKITGTNPGIYSIYDTYLRDVSTSNFLINPSGCYNASFSISSLSQLVTPCAINFSGTNNTSVTTNTIWSNGTSLSHYSIGICGNPGNYSMNPSLALGVTRRFPDIAEVTTLCDIGYSTSGTYPGATYPGTGTCGLRVAGVNDFATYTTTAPGTNYQTAFNTAYTFSSTDILGNDENASFYECMEVVNLSGTLSGPLSGGVGNNITFTPNTGYSGVAILRYVPRLNSVGQRGNTTYVFILVMPPPLPPCTPNLCEMICYGGFEEFSSQLQYDIYTTNGSVNPFNDFNFSTSQDNSPDLNQTFVPAVWSCGGAFTGGITANTGSNFLGLILRTDNLGNNHPEGPAFPLNSPLNPGETATVSLWARLGNALCMGGIEIRFTNIQPCGGNTILTSCSGLIQSATVQSAALANNTSWQQLTFTYTNVTGVSLTHLLINSLPFQIYGTPPIGYIFIDDISCIKNTPNLQIIKTGPTSACPNDIINYNILICNNSTFPANSVQINDILSTGLTYVSGGTFTFPTTTIPVLPAGGCVNYDLNAQVISTLGSVTNTANVASGGCLVNTTSNSVTTSINQQTLIINQTVDNSNPPGGGTINLTVDICNYTPNPVNGINFQTVVPIGAIITPGTGYTIIGGSTINFNTFNLGAGSITSPDCATFVIPITFPCGVSGNICSYLFSGGNVCLDQNYCNPITTTLPNITVTPPSPTITVGGNVSLLASGASTYSWVPATGLSCTNCPNPIASPTVTTTYTVTGTDANGCMNTTTVTVTVIPVPGCTSCTPLATSGTLSTSPAGFQTYCINNNITITGAVNFNISEFKMAPGVIVTVDPGAILSINGSHIYSCSDMWQGIVVKPGGRVIVQNFTLGSFINRSSLIEDAFVAIDIPSLASVTNNPLTVDNATFNRNQISIRIDNYSTTSGPTTYPMSIVNSVFTCRDIPFTPNSLAWPQTNAIKSTSVVPVLQSPFINNTTYSQTNANAFLKPPFSTGVAKPLAGIRLSRVGTTLTPATPTYYEIKIGAPGVPKFNVFDNLSICIDAENSNFTCVNNVFQNNPASQKTGIAINAIARELFNCRLQVIPAAANNFINKFYDCGRAINSVNYFENIATNCEVRSSVPTSAVAPVAPTLPFLGQYGFFAVTNRFRMLNFSNNTMYNIVNGITFNANFGPYQVGGFVPSGQYSGQVNINSNTIQPHAPGNPITTQYVANAITVTNVVASGLTLLSGTNVSVNNNIISSVYRGIGVDTWSKKDVKTNNNTITMVADPFFIPAPPATPTTTPLQYGIGHRANAAGVSFGNSIVGNTITGPGIGTNPNVRAIVTAMCSNQIVRCNIVSNTFKGIEFNGNNSPTSFNHNDMSNHRFGFVLDNAGFIGVQGNSTNPSDNRWLGTWTGGNFRTATLATTTASTAIGSELWVRNTSTAFNPNGSGFTSGTFFQDDYFNNGSAASTLKYITNNPLYAACPISICCLGPFPLIANMEKIVQDQDSLYGNVPQTRYINKNKVYRMLRQDQSLMTSSPVLQNFYNDGFVGTKEVLASVEDDLAMSDITSAETKTNGLVPQNTIEQNYKTFFEIYMKQQTDTVSYNDSVNIVALALGCPFTDGEVVYQARALYNSIYMTNVIFEDNCSVESREFNLNQKPVVKNQKPSIYKVYPNPSTGEFVVELNSEELAPFSVRIADMQNRTIYTETSFNKLLKLNADVENGAYMLHITNIKTNVTVIQKLVIQK